MPSLTHFSAARQAHWAELERLLARSDGNGLRGFDAEQIEALGRAYRQVISDLAIARRDFPQGIDGLAHRPLQPLYGGPDQLPAGLPVGGLKCRQAQPAGVQPQPSGVKPATSPPAKAAPVREAVPAADVPRREAAPGSGELTGPLPVVAPTGRGCGDAADALRLRRCARDR